MGELYNEVPDRVSDAATLIGLGHAAEGWPVLGFLAAILVSRILLARPSEVAAHPRLFRPDGKAAPDVRRDRDGTALRARADFRAASMARPRVGPAHHCARGDRAGLCRHGRAQAAASCPLPESENGMNAATWQRLFGSRHAFDEPIVVLITAVLTFLLVLSPLVILGLDRTGRDAPTLKADLWQRYGRGW